MLERLGSVVAQARCWSHLFVTAFAELLLVVELLTGHVAHGWVSWGHHPGTILVGGVVGGLVIGRRGAIRVHVGSVV